MIAALAFNLILIVLFVECATSKKNDPTLLWFGAVISFGALLINVILYAARIA